MRSLHAEYYPVHTSYNKELCICPELEPPLLVTMTKRFLLYHMVIEIPRALFHGRILLCHGSSCLSSSPTTNPGLLTGFS
ncbi:hypothetical protein GT037_003986 [Alternaria burnsii]|uniref:Uncharacterized protein n=1 Tax=Alternaria burnsii TaxID=1187904 RepID=A0A8H7EG42_9PLEO|nr:uncharacterized protein GT037_003986 [Alternaria burnsii]KAF7678605.1 hypothetical protein GT037_003986 [Alternaria burnsii]